MLRLPDNTYRYRRSFSAHFKSLQKSQLSSSKLPTKTSMRNLNPKKDHHKPQHKSLLLQEMMKNKIKNDEQKKEIFATPSVRALYEQKLIPPCGINFQYYISEKAVLEVVNSRRLIEPRKMLSNSLKSRPITPKHENEFKKYPKQYRTPRKNPGRRKYRKQQKKGKVKKNDVVIEPWEIREETGDFIESRK